MEEKKGRRPQNKRGRREREFQSEILSTKRVAKVTAGAKRLRFSVLVAVGDEKGRVGLALGRGKDVRQAMQKAYQKAVNTMIKVPITKEAKSLPHRVENKYKAAQVVIKPARTGKGIVAGGSVRRILSLAGYHNAVAKQIGSNNAVANAYCAFRALHKLNRYA